MNRGLVRNTRKQLDRWLGLRWDTIDAHTRCTVERLRFDLDGLLVNRDEARRCFYAGLADGVSWLEARKDRLS